MKETFRSGVGVSLEAHKVSSLIKVRSTSSFLGLTETDFDGRTAFRESRRHERSTSEAKRSPEIPSVVRIRGWRGRIDLWRKPQKAPPCHICSCSWFELDYVPRTHNYCGGLEARSGSVGCIQSPRQRWTASARAIPNKLTQWRRVRWIYWQDMGQGIVSSWRPSIESCSPIRQTIHQSIYWSCLFWGGPWRSVREKLGWGSKEVHHRVYGREGQGEVTVNILQWLNFASFDTMGHVVFGGEPFSISF